MTLTVLLSARDVHEIGILALQIDELVVMKLMSGSKKGMRDYTERVGSAVHYRLHYIALA
jgi:hypothetical protein